MAGSVPPFSVLSLFPAARYNRTNYFYPTFSENSEHSHLLVSPVLVASAVIGVVIILSCITIIVGSLRKERQAQAQQNQQLQYQYHRNHRRRRRRSQEYELGQGKLLPTSGATLLSNGDCTQEASGRGRLCRERGRVVREGILEVLGDQEELSDAHHSVLSGMRSSAVGQEWG